MDKWLTRKKGPTTETPATTTDQLISEDAFSSDRTGDCSKTMCSSDLDASTDVSVVASQAASIAGDSRDEVSDAERQSGRKHDSSDCNTTSSKKRKYDDNYVSLGFTCINIGGFSQPQCVICAKVLSQNSMKPSLLRRHLETNHPHLKNKPREYFERQLKSLSTSKTCIQVPDLMNKNRLQASYMVSYRVAKTNKPHTIVEDLILPAALDMVGTMLGEKAKKTIQSIPSSNNTVSWRISAMSENVLQQLLLRIRHSEFYAIQLDESTDVAGLAHLLVYVRYIHEGTIKEDMLFCKPLEQRTTAADIFQKLDTFMNTHGLAWDRCVGICTDGARAMTGRHGGVVSRVQAVAPDASWVHCSIHREALAAKGIPVRLKHVLDTSVKMVNFVKARPLNSCLFAALCNEMGSEHETLLLHTEVRWLCRGKVLTRFFELRDELKVFFSNHPFELSKHLHDEEYLTCLALCDIFSRLNELNLGLQGAMIKKLNLWKNCMDANNTEVFPVLHDFLCSNDLTLSKSIKRECNVHLEELAVQLRRYFPETDGSNDWIRHPFTAESLIEIATDGSLKVEHAQKTLADFWIGLLTEQPTLAKRAVKTLMPFATTYLCERGFSALTNMKTKYRARLCVENDLRLSLSQIEPNNEELCASAQAHPSH
ncbi:hypothetical protein ACER0C_017463 [Sarotherodon galilaeus]